MRFRRQFRRRFFRRRRKKTEWITGFDQRFNNDILMEPVVDAGNNPICKTLSITLAGGSDFDSFQSGFRVERIVGDFNIFIAAGAQLQPAPQGAEIRMSIQRQRTYPNVAIQSGGAVVALADDPALHSSMFVADDLGDEEIYWTRRLYQPSTANTGVSLYRGADTVGAETQPYQDFIVGQNAQKLSQGLPFLDLSVRHRVTQDNQLFFYVDVVDGDGTPYATANQTFARLQGYARILITPL